MAGIFFFFRLLWPGSVFVFFRLLWQESFSSSVCYGQNLFLLLPFTVAGIFFFFRLLWPKSFSSSSVYCGRNLFLLPFTMAKSFSFLPFTVARIFFYFFRLLRPESFFLFFRLLWPESFLLLPFSVARIFSSSSVYCSQDHHFACSATILRFDLFVSMPLAICSFNYQKVDVGALTWATILMHTRERQELRSHIYARRSVNSKGSNS